jgi:predicted metal-dependent hydrolase
MPIQIDQLIRSKRRSIGLTITQDARLIVRAPHWTPQYEIERLLSRKEHWINQKQALSRQRLCEMPPKITLEEKIALKRKALEHLRQRVAYYANLTGLTYKSVKINEAKTRWGSCSYTGAINFTWRLILAPERVIDYVVVHELMHLKQPNHSFRFWNEVKNLVPDYKQDEKWLKNNGHRLRF